MSAGVVGERFSTDPRDATAAARQRRLRPSKDLHDQAVAKCRGDLRDARNGWIFVSGTTTVIWVGTSFAGG